MISNEDNSRVVSNILQKVIILNGDFEKTLKYAKENIIYEV